jgi:hypothetical protein
MRSHHVAIAAALVVGFGVALLFASRPTAEANVDALTSSRIDVSKMHGNAALPEEKMHDMTFVFTRGE